MSGVRLEITDDVLRPLVAQIVEETIERVADRNAKLGGRLSYSIKEAAAITGLSVGTLREARARGLIKGSIVGRRLIFERGELQRLVRESQD